MAYIFCTQQATVCWTIRGVLVELMSIIYLPRQKKLRDKKVVLLSWLAIRHFTVLLGPLMGATTKLFFLQGFENPLVLHLFREPWRHIFSLVSDACCILHDICVAVGDVMEAEEKGPGMDDGDDPGEAEVYPRDQAGSDVRGRLADQLSAPEELPACLSEHDYI